MELKEIQSAIEEHGADILTDDELSMYIESIDQEEKQVDQSHYANLAEDYDSKTLQKLATEVINWVDWDEQSREEWSIREAKGIRLLGVSDKVEGGANFEGSSKVVHPLLAEAIVQFQSRAIEEMWPEGGIVKTNILGNKTPEVEDQARRVEGYLNYLYTQKMEGAFEETDQMLFRLPLSGSCFKKIFFDPIRQSVTSKLVEPSDFIVPYSAVDLETAPRYTHRVREMHNDVLKKIAIGYYVDSNLNRPTNEDYEYPRVLDEVDATEGKDRTQIDDDQRHSIFEMHLDYNLDNLEKGVSNYNDKEVALPYIVTVNRDDQTVLRIQRNWVPEDQLKVKRKSFVHYKFTPGLGFYGYGLLHLVGGLENSATGALRALLDSAQYDNLQGGFKTRDSKVKGGDKPLAPGEWRETDASIEDLNKAFFPIPSKQPSAVLFNLLGYLDERAQRLSSTTDALVGDVPANMPVGTAMQNQENGSKVFSAIHKRLHKAQNREFKIVARVSREHMPEGGYPYAMSGTSSTVMYEDFDERIDVIPISDPNLISNAHRITQAQGVIELSTAFPNIVNQAKAVELMLKAMRVADIEELMTPEESNGQEEMAHQLAMDKLQKEIDKISSEIEKIDAERTSKNVEGLFAALQAGQTVALAPDVAPLADEIYLSAGGIDKNGPPIVTPPGAPMDLVNDAIVPQNTDPRFPANPESPVIGINEGIETNEVDSLL